MIFCVSQQIIWAISYYYDQSIKAAVNIDISFYNKPVYH